jgi:hypothetical protein
MNRALILSLVGALIGGGVGFAIATADDGEGPILIASDQPITAQQVLEKLRSEGWTNLEVEQLGRYFEVTGAKDGQAKKIMVNSLTGRLIEADED